MSVYPLCFFCNNFVSTSSVLSLCVAVGCSEEAV